MLFDSIGFGLQCTGYLLTVRASTKVEVLQLDVLETRLFSAKQH
jgi:hypothetical protein